jgi:hypothetical protein
MRQKNQKKTHLASEIDFLDKSSFAKYFLEESGLLSRKIKFAF